MMIATGSPEDVSQRRATGLHEIHDILAGSGEEDGKPELEVELTAGQIAAQISQFE